MRGPEPIQPLFILTENPEQMGNAVIRFTRDDYNKELGEALIDANNDAEAISSFLQEYKESKALKILDSFFNYLVQAHYLIGNPLAVDRRRKKRHQTKPRIIDRYLELDEIRATLDALANHPVKDNKTQWHHDALSSRCTN